MRVLYCGKTEEGRQLYGSANRAIVEGFPLPKLPWERFSMLTPAEELGLSGLSLASRVRKAFDQIPQAGLIELTRQIHDQSFQRHMFYLRDGEADIVHIMPCPLTALPDQLAYIHVVTLTLQNALKRLPDLYFQDVAVREVLRLPPEEECWLRECWGPSQRENNPIFGRYDAVVDFLSPMWKDSLRFLEPNMSGIGGLHLMATAEAILASLVLPPAPRPQSAAATASRPGHPQALLIQEVLEHLETLGRPARNVCFVEPKYAGTGPDEQEELAQFYHERFRLKVLHADPAELSLRDGEVYYGEHQVDLAYRDYAVYDLIDLEREGGERRADAPAVSPEPGDFLDRRGTRAEEVLGSADRSAIDPKVFQHGRAPAISPARSVDAPPGRPPDPVARRADRRAAGVRPAGAGNTGVEAEPGLRRSGVVLGPGVSQAEWQEALAKAVPDPERWVVQQLASIPVSEFPVIGPDGAIHTEPFYMVMGFAPTKYGVAILGRASQKQVVNVAQRGGICAVMFGRPPARLVGPAPFPRRSS